MGEDTKLDLAAQVEVNRKLHADRARLDQVVFAADQLLKEPTSELYQYVMRSALDSCHEHLNADECTSCDRDKATCEWRIFDRIIACAHKLCKECEPVAHKTNT